MAGLFYWAQQMKNLYLEYEYLKNEWKLRHPNATSQEYEAAIQKIAKRLGI